MAGDIMQLAGTTGIEENWRPLLQRGGRRRAEISCARGAGSGATP
jgi:hypothetical protein